jgi:hypothetical protein
MCVCFNSHSLAILCSFAPRLYPKSGRRDEAGQAFSFYLFAAIIWIAAKMKYVADPQMAPNLVPEIFSNSFLFFPSRFYFIPSNI